jgi:hypothetical protein
LGYGYARLTVLRDLVNVQHAGLPHGDVRSRLSPFPTYSAYFAISELLGATTSEISLTMRLKYGSTRMERRHNAAESVDCGSAGCVGRTNDVYIDNHHKPTPCMNALRLTPPPGLPGTGAGASGTISPPDSAAMVAQ